MAAMIHANHSILGLAIGEDPYMGIGVHHTNVMNLLL